MRKTLLMLALLLGLRAFSQSSNHSLYLGSNLSGIDLDLTSSGISGLEHKDFYNSKIGFNVGYKYLLSLPNKLTVGIGLDFQNINSNFLRPYYNYPDDINPNLTSVNENLKFYRFSLPVQGYYDVLKKENHSLYLSLGSVLNLITHANRTADYKIPSPPTGYVDGRFKGKQKINGEKLTFGFLAAVGNEIVINKMTYFVELSYYSDISKNTIQTLHNIEFDNVFEGKLKYFQLKLGHIFSLRSRNRE